MGMWSIKAQHMVCVTSSEWCFCLGGVWQCPSQTLLDWSVRVCCCWLKQLESTPLYFGWAKWRITKSVLYHVFFIIKYTCGKIWRKTALSKQWVHFSCVSGSGRARVHDWLYTSKYVHNVCDNVFPKDFWAHSTAANVHSGGRTEFK